ncbi:SpoIIE family protein phosphatase [Streptomyces fulvoviolaceus]|uniref:SpoIIE family protein phosphatase n=1 Tax=Streptomyces fulvoviolaceus TaxID=285535 RepID=UPI000693F3E6|nr:SpoIIE family protein phosphatase [Streptomyces fulvoviolaceus]
MDAFADHPRDRPFLERADRQVDAALGQALLAQDQLWVTIHDLDLRITQTNFTAWALDAPPVPPDSALHSILAEPSVGQVEELLRRVLETGAPDSLQGLHLRLAHAPGRVWELSVSAFRLIDSRGRSVGVAALYSDATTGREDLTHRAMRHEASLRIGRSLDVVRTAQDLADVLVPTMGDLAAVTLAEAVLDGNEPARAVGGGELHMRQVAVASADGHWPDHLLQAGARWPRLPDSQALWDVQRGGVVAVIGREQMIALSGLSGDPALIRLLVPLDVHACLVAPLSARGLLLGSVLVWRTRSSSAFEQEDAEMLREIVTRGALSVDNARRYAREHRTATVLQQRLLPRATSDVPAVETAGSYVPAGGGAEVGGDWFDVIPLPSLRVAMVVGDVIGHGLHATATMGQLRSAVRTLADLELAPDELLTHADDLVQKLAEEAADDQRDTIGATCLYAVYDPVSQQCALASAGHPPPVLIRPDGSSETLAIAPGPPLGVGGMPFEITRVRLEPDSVLALYTDGLTRLDGDDPEGATARLVDALATFCRSESPKPSLGDVGRTLLAEVTEPEPRDDATLLLARVRAVRQDATAVWEFPADPAAVADARKAVTRQLSAWQLDDLAFATELIVSELVTNAVRYAGGPISLRLIQDTDLVCEVSDPSNTQPRLRRARTTDEGGRGLFLVAQLARRWGSRYGQSGKTVWAEQTIP